MPCAVYAPYCGCELYRDIILSLILFWGLLSMPREGCWLWLAGGGEGRLVRRSTAGCALACPSCVLAREMRSGGREREGWEGLEGGEGFVDMLDLVDEELGRGRDVNYESVHVC